MEISAGLVRELREKTGVGIMDCKRALAESEGDISAATTYLREKGLAAAQKKAGRATSEGLVLSYIHPGGRVGVLVETNCETDFVARTDEYRAFTRDIAMHIAAMGPLYVERDEVPTDMLGKERNIYRAQARESGKPDKIIEKIVDGKIEKFFKDVCLLEQTFVKNPDLNIEGLVKEAIAKLGENIQVKRFARFMVGEGGEGGEGV
ncbi:MAG: translation elongation factor Ts, partial [Thermodesulfobacteriota bacterium]